MSNAPPPLILNPVKTDYYGIYDDLEVDLIATESWTDLAKAATGSSIMRWIASVGAFGQGGIARALQENFPDTARSPSGILRAVRLQGTHVIRSRPGSVAVTLLRTDALATTLTIPAFTQFMVAGVPFYNRTPVIITATGLPVNAVLYQATVILDSTQVSSGATNQRFLIGTPDLWNVGDLDIWMVDSTNSLWSTVRTGLWRETGGKNTFFENTLPNGTVECLFGDGAYGTIPPKGELRFGYTAVMSAAAYKLVAPTVGSTVSAAGFTVSGTTTGAASINQDPPSPAFYKAMGTGGPAANQRAVTRDDHRAIALEYPGVVDALFQGQAETNPADLRWMNVVVVSLLTTMPWSDFQWRTFKMWLESERGIATTTFIRRDPVGIPFITTINIGANQSADLTALTTIVQDSVANLITPNNSSLGRSLYASDVTGTILENATYQQAPNETGSLVDWIQVPSLSTPILLTPTSYLTYNAANVTVNCSYTKRGISAASTGGIVGL